MGSVGPKQASNLPLAPPVAAAAVPHPADPSFVLIVGRSVLGLPSSARTAELRFERHWSL